MSLESACSILKKFAIAKILHRMILFDFFSNLQFYNKQTRRHFTASLISLVTIFTPL